MAIEGVHPLQCGFGRRKVRSQRRHGLPRENPLIFYPRRAIEIFVEWHKWTWLALPIRMYRKRIAADPGSRNYTDEALQVATATAADKIVEAYADKLPNTYGSPVRQAVG